MRLLINYPLILLCALAISLGACTRKTSGTSTLRLSFGNSVNSKATAQSVTATSTSYVQVIILNITGSGINDPIYYQWNAHGGDGTTMPTPPDTISLMVPRGDNRLIQALVMKSDASGSNTFFYNDAVQTFDSDTADVTLTLAQLNATTSAGDANIAGRYLNASGVGPTSRIRVYLPIPGHPERPQMLVDQSNMMVAGWFRVFSLDGGHFNYMLDDGTNIFGGAVGVDTDAILGTSTDSVRNMRVTVPAFFKDNGNGGTREPNPSSRSIYGWFGPGSVNSGKKICFSQNIDPINSAYSTSTGATQIQWNYQSSASVPTDAFVEMVGGVRGGSASATFDADGLCTAGTTKFVDYIPFADKLLADHDPILGFSGPFQLIFDGSNTDGTTLKASLANGSLTASLMFMPGVQATQAGAASVSLLSAGVDGVDLFGRIETQSNWNGHMDYNGDGDGPSVRCGELLSLPSPFTYLTTQAASTDPNYLVTMTANSLPAAFQTAFASGMTTLIACPYINLSGSGKTYLGVGAIHHPGGGMGQGQLQATSFNVFGPQETSTPKLANGVCTPFHMDFMNGASRAWAPNGAMVSFTAANPALLKFYHTPMSVSACMAGDEITAPMQFYGSRMDFYVMSSDTGNDTQAFTAHVTGLPDVVPSVTLMDQPTITEQVQIHVPSSIKAYDCVPFSADTWDSVNQVIVNIGVSETDNLQTTGFEYYMASSNYAPCQMSGSSSLNFGTTSNHVTGYLRYVGASAGPVSIAPTAVNCPQCTGGTITTVTQPIGPPTKLAMNYSNTVARGDCDQITIDLVDANGNPSPAGSGSLNFSTSAGAAGTFYQFSGCSGSVTSLPLTTTQTRVTVWYKTTGSTGTDTITVYSAAPNVSQTASISITPATASQFAVQLPGQTFAAGSGVSGTATMDFVNPNAVTVYALTFDNQVDPNFQGTSQSLAASSNCSALPGVISFTNGVATFNFNASASGYFQYPLPLPNNNSSMIYGSW